jgi:HAD superfamily hydrolase (TIGR01509 family)
MVKGLLLDIDGTLLDSNQAHAKAWSHALKHFGYEVASDEVLTLIGMGGDRVLSALVPGLDKSRGRGKEISEYRKKYLLDKVVPGLKPTLGARELVKELKQRKIKLVVATSASEEEFKNLLKKAQVDDLLPEYTTASDVENSKPAPDILKVALQKIKLKPSEVLMLGDTPYDIAAAKKTGISTIALRSGGFSDEQLKGAIAIYNNPKDLLKNLDHVLIGKDYGELKSPHAQSLV